VFDPPRAVEVLIFEVRADAVERWLTADHELWTLAEAARFPALVDKEIWLGPEGPWRKVTVVITWTSLEAWRAVDMAWVEGQERRFAEVVGAGSYRLVSAPHEVEQFHKINEYR